MGRILDVLAYTMGFALFGVAFGGLTGLFAGCAFSLFLWWVDSSR